MWVAHSNSWKRSAPYVEHNGSWVLANAVFVESNNQWRPAAQAIGFVTISPDHQGAFFGGVGTTVSATVWGQVSTEIDVGYGPLTYQWSIVSGPGIIDDPTSLWTRVNSSSPGTTVYRFRATDTLTGQWSEALATVEWT